MYFHFCFSAVKKQKMLTIGDMNRSASEAGEGHVGYAYLRSMGRGHFNQARQFFPCLLDTWDYVMLASDTHLLTSLETLTFANGSWVLGRFMAGDLSV